MLPGPAGRTILQAMTEHKPDPEPVTPPAAPPAGAPAAPPTKLPKEVGGAKGPEPTRYGDWQHKGRVTDF